MSGLRFRVAVGRDGKGGHGYGGGLGTVTQMMDTVGSGFTKGTGVWSFVFDLWASEIASSTTHCRNGIPIGMGVWNSQRDLRAGGELEGRYSHVNRSLFFSKLTPEYHLPYSSLHCNYDLPPNTFPNTCTAESFQPDKNTTFLVLFTLRLFLHCLRA